MAATERPMSFLPTIKCSDCGIDIDIAALADHVCAGSSKPLPPLIPDPLSPRSKLDRAATFGFGSNSRLRIDANAANEPFRPLQPQMSRDQLSPLSDYSNPNSFSPRSPVSRPTGGQRYKLNRSATSPMPGVFGPPSPDLAPNMDSPFPTFPTSRTGTPTGSKSTSRERGRAYNHQYAEPSPMYAPLSPQSNSGESVLKRMNTIAPGPFGGRGHESRPSTSGRMTPGANNSAMGHKRTATQASVGSNGRGMTGRESLVSNKSTTSTRSNGSVGLPARPKPGFGGPPLPRPPKAEGIDAFLDRLHKETRQPSQIGQNDRSKISPPRQESRDALDAKPMPPRPRRPSESNGPGLRNNNMFPARSAGRGGSRSGIRLEVEQPPLPPLPTDLSPKPLHTPSDSGLSDDSVSSSGFRSAASSRSSPPASERFGHSRATSKASRMDSPATDRMPPIASPEPYWEAPPLPKTEYGNNSNSYGRGEAQEPSLRAPPKPRMNDQMPPMDPAIQTLDPAVQSGLDQRSPSEPQPFTSYRAPPPELPRSQPNYSFESETRRPPNRRPTTANKGKCRGCSEPIIGKSIKAADGRLTGRYHKECFVCKTCRAPFQTADFYVFENFPYCEQHYHRLNGSLCQSCNTGIEGQYLETDVRQKFHPRCFTCFTCRMVLRDGYFDVGGRVFCERHANHARQQNLGGLGPNSWGNRRLEKRSTRLMMMV